MGIMYFVPLLVFVGLGFYYLNIYRKGKATGGGFMAGVQASHDEKWKEHLEPGEHLRHWGTGVLWRPSWQYFLTSQVPMLRLVWPTKAYQLVITDRGRLLVATYSAIGTLSNKKSYPDKSVRLDGLVEEKQGLAMRLNPLVPKDYKTYTGTLVFPDEPLKLVGIPGNFVEQLGGPQQAALPATRASTSL